MQHGYIEGNELADYLHAFPHLNRSLYDIPDKNFNASNGQYMQSIEVYCFSGIALGLVLFLTFAFIQCCIGCRKCGNYTISYRMKQYNPILTTFLFFSTVAIMVCAGGAIYYGVGQIEAQVNNMSLSIGDISHTIDEYNNLVHKLGDELDTLKNNSFLLPKGDTIAAKLKTITSELRRDNIPDFRDDLGKMVKYDRLRELATLGILFLQLLSCSVLLIGICYGRVFMLHCSLIMLTISMMLLSGTLGFYLAGAVASADICVEHRELAAIIAHIQNFATDVLKIITNCSDKESGGNLLVLQDLNSFIKFIHSSLGPSDKVVPVISHTLASITEEAGKLEKLTTCQKIVQDYENILAVLCKPFLLSMCQYCLWSCLGVFFGWFVINQLKPFADRVEEWMKVECILDKNITITPDEGDSLLPDEDNYPPSYNRKSYGSSNLVYLAEEEESVDESIGDRITLIQNEQSLYQSLISNNHLLARKMGKSM